MKYFEAPEFSGSRGTGKRRGLGLAAGVLSMAVLGASVLFATFVNGLSFPVLARPCLGGTGGRLLGTAPIRGQTASGILCTAFSPSRSRSDTDETTRPSFRSWKHATTRLAASNHGGGRGSDS